MFGHLFLQSTNFQPRNEAGGVAVDSHGNIVVAAVRAVEYYTMTGQFIRSFSDQPITSSDYKHSNKGFERIRKEIAISSNDDVFISDPNTSAIRGQLFTSRLYIVYLAKCLNHISHNVF